MRTAFDATEAEKRAREEAMRIDSLRTLAFPDSDCNMLQCTFDKDDGARPDVTAGMKNYCENFPYLRRLGKGILLYGTVGTGKSFFAACIVNDLVSKGYRCMMTTFPRLTNQISALWDGKQEFIDDLTRYDLIAIDDLGVERDTEYMNEHITMIVDALYRAKVPLVITSNYTPKQMKGESEIRRQRIYDRLIEQCHPVEMSGESRRVIKGRKDYLEMKKLLGV
jgi:DNA replication protein DnaC